MRALSVDETPFTTSYCYLPPQTPGIHHYYRQHSSQLTPAKTVFVHRNGDPFFVGRKFVVNKRHIPTFEHFLVEVTRRVPLDLGAAQRIYTPRHGSRVRNLEELKQGQRVVAAGKECFKKIDYLQISPRKSQVKKEEVIKPVVHSGIVVSSKWANYVRDSCTINVFKNGDILVPPLRMLISKHTLKDWDHVLAAIAEKVHPSIGSVQRLYTIDGHRVFLGEIKNNQYYVAVGKEKFKRLPYSQWLPKGYRVEAQSKLSHTQGDRKKNEQLDKFSSRPDEHGQCDIYVKQIYQEPSFTSKEEKYTFHINSKDLKHSKELPPIMPKPERGIFRAYSGREEFRGAAEVPEDKQMKVELPIDQIPADVIHEEEIPFHSEEQTRGAMHNKEKTVQDSQASHNLLYFKEERGANEDFDKMKYSNDKDLQEHMAFQKQLVNPYTSLKACLVMGRVVLCSFCSKIIASPARFLLPPPSVRAHPAQPSSSQPSLEANQARHLHPPPFSEASVTRSFFQLPSLRTSSVQTELKSKSRRRTLDCATILPPELGSSLQFLTSVLPLQPAPS